MPNGEFNPSRKTLLVSATPLPSPSRSSVMRFAVGVLAPARPITNLVTQALIPLPSSGFGGALVSATSTSPLGSTYTVRGWSSPVAKALTAIPLAAVGLPPAVQPIALATLTVGIQELCGAGRVGEGPKVCSVTAVSCSLQAASGSVRIPINVTSERFLAGITLLRM